MAACLTARAAHADPAADDALRPENVAVVVNADSWASGVLADAYVRLRGIPPRNVFTVSGLSSFESIGIDEFRERILRPVLAALDDRGLRDTIDCLAYSADVRYSIAFYGDLRDMPYRPVTGGVGALTGLTYLYEAVLARQPQGYTALDSNFYARRASVGALPPPLTPDERKMLAEAERCFRAEDVATSLSIMEAYCEQYPRRATGHYWRTLTLAAVGDTAAAGAALATTVAAGWYDVDGIESQPLLEAVRTLPAWKGMLDGVRENQRNLAVQPAHRFHARTAWDRTGQPTAAGGGRRYLLSTMLGATSGRGMSLREAVDALARAAAADGSRPAGTIVYMTNDDVRTRARRWGFEAAVRMLREAGVAAVIEAGALPNGRRDVAGAMGGVPDFDWPGCGSRILPGAICEHLTSGGGIVAWGDGQTPLTEFLRHGAAGASGTVFEPLAIQEKFPDPFIHVHYVHGSSLAEAFYQSVAGPYQLLIVGDPLCRPWGKGPAAAAPARCEIPAVAGPVRPSGRPADGDLGRGFRVIDAAGSRAVSGTNGVQPWWQAAAIPANGRLSIAGHVEVGSGGLHQFQVRGDGDVTLAVSGHDLPATGRGPWRTYPVNLEPRWHAVRLTVQAGATVDKPAEPPLEVNFGATGTPPLIPQLWRVPQAEDRVRHVGLAPRITIPEASADPLTYTVRFAIDGLQPTVSGTLAMRWEMPADSGWKIAPTTAETRVTKGVVEPFSFRMQYSRPPFAADDFYRSGTCHLEVRTDFGTESADAVGLPLALLLTERPRPQVEIGRTGRPPTIDGRLDDACWSGPAPLDRFVRPGLDKPVTQPTEAWLAWDETCVYLAARCTEPRMDKLRTKAKQRDATVYADDCVEFFVGSADDPKTYYQVVINAAGTVYDGRGYDSSWNGDFEAATARGDGSWTVEIAMPWKTFTAAAPGIGAGFRVLIGRNRPGERSGEVSTWPAAPGGNHQPRSFADGVLRGGQ